MHVLWVFAHPEQRSYSAALRDEGLAALREAGHSCELSDLYAMGWKATVDRDDFGDGAGTDAPPDERLVVTQASRDAYRSGTLSADIRAEHDKLRRADALVLQFPLWWYSTPALLKGWIDRVFVKGFAYGVRDPGSGATLRYGEGTLSGKRALVIVTTGSAEAALGPRGINGQLDEVLFPLLHGTLWYVGMSVLPPLAIYGADRVDDQQYAASAAAVRERVSALEHANPIAYRYQNGGDYDDDLVLHPDLAPGRRGLAVHTDDPDDRPSR